MTEALLEPRMTEPKPGKTPSGKPVSIVVLKGSREYRDWLSSFSDFSRMPISVLIDRALAKLAKEEGFPDPPPKR